MYRVLNPDRLKGHEKGAFIDANNFAFNKCPFFRGLVFYAASSIKVRSFQ